jgi:hypothetical protein
MGIPAMTAPEPRGAAGGMTTILDVIAFLDDIAPTPGPAREEG